MELRRAAGLGAMVLGLALAVAAKASGNEAVAIFATAFLVGGAVAVAISFREAAGHAAGGSRLSLVLHRAKGRLGTVPSGDGSLQEYAGELNDELALCRRLLSLPPGDSTGTEGVEVARERLMVLVANPGYGEAIVSGLVDEAAVRAVSEGLAARAG